MTPIPTPIRDLPTLLATLEPQVQSGIFVFTSVPPGTSIAPTAIVASIREPEGMTLILPEAEAQQAGLPILARCAWITLTVASDLYAVGLTAAVATALTHVGISCNIVAGAYHDHLFVPVEAAPRALVALHALQAQARGHVPAVS
ncbi:MAG: ACT domain-containing protein [Candidatus Viridilinea halotolerans]|uniref:ACT domain-containing protein n=1 Tax=Candidatus Viridilinea halotolerans TaxID=2491704 RepID=A0A426U8N0_9CHLR|nr:MAG: ACT domain-containing protein [Candidatus Viridilinea halotolerans]